MECLIENWELLVALILAFITGDLGLKLGKLRPVIKAIFESASDKKLDDEERLRLFKNAEAIIKGLFWNKSKVE